MYQTHDQTNHPSDVNPLVGDRIHDLYATSSELRATRRRRSHGRRDGPPDPDAVDDRQAPDLDRERRRRPARLIQPGGCPATPRGGRSAATPVALLLEARPVLRVTGRFASRGRAPVRRAARPGSRPTTTSVIGAAMRNPSIVMRRTVRMSARCAASSSTRSRPSSSSAKFDSRATANADAEPASGLEPADHRAPQREHDQQARDRGHAGDDEGGEEDRGDDEPDDRRPAAAADLPGADVAHAGLVAVGLGHRAGWIGAAGAARVRGSEGAGGGGGRRRHQVLRGGAACGMDCGAPLTPQP